VFENSRIVSFLFSHLESQGLFRTRTVSLAGKIALVTGGATGLGFAICRELLSQGAVVVMVGNIDAHLQEAGLLSCNL
jgi:hypothetical protein